eukprot:TRINITY_DN1139_c0_g1_i5.p1 TRINITY_DN1139_c0_g1~~TRINITY_DN1139_c0_g1_i5.p1  ORF type:complete len:154 (+),score=19.27 TRINITY_DN1139_c0_g1_i5:614-1075(+)
MKDYKKHGKGMCSINAIGILYLADGSRYEGEFENDAESGTGTAKIHLGIYYYTTRNKYEGEYKDGKRNGQGIYYYANGDKYEGQFSDDKKKGNGTYTYADGSKYEGEWEDDAIEGKGSLHNHLRNLYLFQRRKIHRQLENKRKARQRYAKAQQ